MKKAFFLLLVLSLSVLIISAAGTEDSILPNINSVLQYGLPNEKIEVCDNLDEYSVFNDTFDEIEKDFRILILQREAPEKEFSSLKVYPPFSDSDGFPLDFEGTDVGTARIWLRSDIMNLIPTDFRASSIENANYLILAENVYLYESTLVVSDYKDSSDETLPEFKNLEEMNEYFRTHQREITSKTYYPMFCAYSIISLYDTQTKKVSLVDVIYTPANYLADNREASEQWDRMCLLLNLIDSLDENTGIDLEYAYAAFDAIDYVPQGKINLWISCIEANEYSTACHSITDYFWTMAADLRDIDPSEANRSNYDLIIQEKDIDTLIAFVNFCNYSGFDTPIATVESLKLYIVSPDYEWMEKALKETIGITE